jgi:hypothetical protein
MSYDERIVLAFSEEAYWDLEAAKHLLQFIDLRLCGTDPKVFYLGRRVLYLLQQASEKAVKAYLLGYFKPLLEKLTLPRNIKIARSKHFEVHRISELLRNILDLVKAEKIGHEPFIAITKVVCMLYELFYKRKRELSKYAELYVMLVTQSSVDRKSKDFAEMIKGIVRSILVQQYVNAIASLELSLESSDGLDQSCSELRDIKKKELLESVEPPCITEDSAHLLVNAKKGYEKLIFEIKSRSTAEQLYVSFSSILKEVFKVIERQTGASEKEEMSRIDELIETHVKPLIEKITPCFQNFVQYLGFISYIIVYVLSVDPCLALYERLGRYPGRFPESLETLDTSVQEAICRDIRGLESLIREVEYVVDEVRKSVEALQELRLCFLQSLKPGEF